MGKHTRSTLLAWPYPGRERLPGELVALLDAAGLLPARDEPNGHTRPGGDVAVVLTGDMESGSILAAERDDPDEAPAEVIDALVAAGLHVYAGSEPGGGYCAAWAYHPPAGTGHAVQRMRYDRGAPCLDADELLEDGTASGDVRSGDLNAWPWLMLNSPDGVPVAVLLAAH